MCAGKQAAADQAGRGQFQKVTAIYRHNSTR
jgi:hypothetical protein